MAFCNFRHVEGEVRRSFGWKSGNSNTTVRASSGMYAGLLLAGPAGEDEVRGEEEKWCWRALKRVVLPVH